ncbi:crocetin glucosyltransferase, chloroplastic-like [Typha angustifolia]|uniref:crocetin glucosyltransferase, chloroplastic-like n=1 Tax=Typha angustifolia TaxID=59011 RepID=UPI003C2C8329
MEEYSKQHLLVVAYPAQGHLNPSLRLAKKLARLGAVVTFSTTVSAHRRMFPDASPPDQEVSDDELSYLPFSDGQDDAVNDHPFNEFYSRLKHFGERNLSKLVVTLRDRNRPVTCIIVPFLLPWVADVAHNHAVPYLPYWIQPVTVFAIYYHYVRGDARLITEHIDNLSSVVRLPGLPPILVSELPSFFTQPVDDEYSSVFGIIRDTFDAMEKETTWRKPKVLVNSFGALEKDVIPSIDAVDLVMVGPFLPSLKNKSVGDLFEPDEKEYMNWLDAQPERTVVYVSFGSLAQIPRRQMEEITRGLRTCGRPYLLVVRKDNRELEAIELESGDNAMVVEWCNQVRVLGHRSVGCFVSHCGWNSTMEGLVAGVPFVGFPQWADQRMNARMLEDVSKTGVRAVINEEGILEAEELRRCLELVMGDGERASEIRNNANEWKEKVREAAGDGGSSDQNLRAFLKELEGNMLVKS